MDDLLDLDKLCRGCLKQGRNLPDMAHLKMWEKPFVDIFSTVLGDNIYSDEHPKLICFECILKAKLTYAFKQQCEKAFHRISNFLNMKRGVEDPFLFVYEDTNIEEPVIETEQIVTVTVDNIDLADEDSMEPDEVDSETNNTETMDTATWATCMPPNQFIIGSLSDHNYCKKTTWLNVARHKRYVCMSCEIFFESFWSFQDHIEIIHIADDRKLVSTQMFICRICGSKSSYKSEHKLHLFKHRSGPYKYTHDP